MSLSSLFFVLLAFVCFFLSLTFFLFLYTAIALTCVCTFTIKIILPHLLNHLMHMLQVITYIGMHKPSIYMINIILKKRATVSYELYETGL